MITRQDVFKEIPSIKKVKESEDNKFLWVSLYKAAYMCVRLILDVRQNQVKIMEKLGIDIPKEVQETPVVQNVAFKAGRQMSKTNFNNAVIKDTDQIK